MPLYRFTRRFSSSQFLALNAADVPASLAISAACYAHTQRVGLSLLVFFNHQLFTTVAIYQAHKADEKERKKEGSLESIVGRNS